MRLPLLLILTLLECGCTWDLSNAEPYQDIVGNNVTLLRDVYVVQTPESPVKRLSGLTPAEPLKPRSGLKAGTELQVTRVTGAQAIKTWVVYVSGTGVDPETQEPFEWDYCWSAGGLLDRAPWEDPDKVPERRQLRKKGRVVTEFIRQP